MQAFGRNPSKIRETCRKEKIKPMPREKIEFYNKFEFIRNEYAMLVKIVLCLEKGTINMYTM